jgi:hypothetical protein
MMSALIAENQSRMPCPRIILNEQQAAEIYQCKIDLLQSASPMQAPTALQGQSMRISYMFDVSPKTIRDVWSRRTWQGATRHLWPGEDRDNFDRGIRRIDHENRRNQVIKFILDELARCLQTRPSTIFSLLASKIPNSIHVMK